MRFGLIADSRIAPVFAIKRIAAAGRVEIELVIGIEIKFPGLQGVSPQRYKKRDLVAEPGAERRLAGRSVMDESFFKAQAMGELPHDRIRAVNNLLEEPVFIHIVIGKRIGSLINVSQENEIEVRTIFVDRSGLEILLDIGGKLRVPGRRIQVGIIRTENIEVPFIGNILCNGNLRTEAI